MSAISTKWSNTLKQFVGKLSMNCLSVFDQFVGLALKELIYFLHILFKIRDFRDQKLLRIQKITKFLHFVNIHFRESTQNSQNSRYCLVAKVSNPDHAKTSDCEDIISFVKRWKLLLWAHTNFPLGKFYWKSLFMCLCLCLCVLYLDLAWYSSLPLRLPFNIFFKIYLTKMEYNDFFDI